RTHAVEYVAWKRVCDIQAVRSDEGMVATAQASRDTAKENLEKRTRQAYQHIVLLGVGEDGEGREVRELRLEQENQSALDGSIVWSKLIEAGRAFGQGQLGKQALIHNLRDDDYGRPLDELRDLFWSTPRMPLLFSGETDLQKAIYLAIVEGQLRLVGESDEDR